jgi:hypothetical protein
MNGLNNHIADFLNSNPKNRLVFTKSNKGSIDIGKELGSFIKPHIEDKRLSMKTKDFIDELFKSNIKSSNDIGKFIPIKNLGILFEPELKINFEYFLNTYSSESTLIIEWKGEITTNHLFFLSKEKGLKADLKNLTYSIYEV